MVPNGWSTFKLSEIVKKTQLGTTERHKGELCSDPVPLLKMGNLTWGGFDLTSLETLPRSKVDKTLFLKTGDFLFNTRNTPQLVGKSAVWDVGLIECIFDNNINRISFVDNFDPFYLGYYLNYGRGKAIINSLPAGSTSVAAIYWKDLKNIKLTLPPLPEQRKIASILGIWDKAISTTERLIDNSKQQKKALMQQLLTGKKRLLDDSGKPFEEEWDSVAIGDVVELFNGFAFKSSDALDTGCKWLKIANVGIGEIKWKDSSYLPEEYKNEYKKFSLKVGDIVVAMTRPTLGNQLKIARLKRKSDEALLNQRVAKLLFSDKVNCEYMYQLLSTIEVALKLNSALLGTDPPNLNAKVLHEIQMEMPPLVEQQRIAAVLNNADKEIELFTQQLADLKQEKKALMQQLLTGKRRVKMKSQECIA